MSSEVICRARGRGWATRTALTALLALAAGGTAGADEPGQRTLATAYEMKTRGQLDEAASKFQEAKAAGADPQRVSLELGYLELQRGEIGSARRQFAAAGSGPDAVMAEQARRELDHLPGHVWAEIYADTYGWSRVSGSQQTSDLVPTLRGRVHVRPWLSLDLQVYAFAQATRDVRSRAQNGAGVPEIYADNYAMTGGGLLLRLFERKVGLFAQAGPAVNLLDDGRQRVTFDGRGGLFFGLESGGCRPEVARGVRLQISPCADLYGEGVYVSRFDHNVIGFVRGRAALGWMMTGPVAWQLVAEGRTASDLDGNYWNNFADAGAGHRWRLLAPIPIDLQLGTHVGSYFGRDARDPAPARKSYADLRVQAATYVEF